MTDKDLILDLEEVELFEKYFYALKEFTRKDLSEESGIVHVHGFASILGSCTNTKNKNITKYFVEYLKNFGIKTFFVQNDFIYIREVGESEIYTLDLNPKLVNIGEVNIGEDFFFASNNGRLAFVKFILDNYSVDLTFL
jgi:hypothetical protein